jgi:hypothetical protein
MFVGSGTSGVPVRGRGPLRVPNTGFTSLSCLGVKKTYFGKSSPSVKVFCLAFPPEVGRWP